MGNETTNNKPSKKMTTKRAAETIKIGDVIMPPAREVSLWMRRHTVQNGLSEDALLLTVKEIYEGAPDKTGRWLVIETDHSPEWNAGRERTFPFKFKARPATPWIVKA